MGNGELISLCGEGIGLCNGERIRSPVCVLVGGCGEGIGVCNGQRIALCGEGSTTDCAASGSSDSTSPAL